MMIHTHVNHCLNRTPKIKMIKKSLMLLLLAMIKKISRKTDCTFVCLQKNVIKIYLYMYCKNVIISTIVSCLWENLLICKFACMKFPMYFLFDCYLFMYVHIFACLHEICFYFMSLFFPYSYKNLVVDGKKNLNLIW